MTSSSEEFGNWRKSERSNGSGACVECASHGSTVAVRDTQLRDGTTLALSATAWATFVAELKQN